MITRTDKVAAQLQALGLNVNVTDQIEDLTDGSIEIVGTKFHVQVDEQYMTLVEDVSDEEGIAYRFYDERRSAAAIHKDYTLASNRVN